MIHFSEHERSHGSGKLPWHTLTLVMITIGLFAIGGPAQEGLVFDREAIGQGEIWRLLTGHWIHSDGEHLAWNLVGLGLLGWLIEMSLGHRRLYHALFAGMCLVNLAVWMFMPSLDYYCGLSGILNTLLFVLLIDGWLTTRRRIFALVFIAATAKIVFELMYATAIFTQTSWPAVPAAHLSGALAAVLLFLISTASKIKVKIE